MNGTIEWINHAGFLFRDKSLALVCDPWIDGTAFNDGWRLISPTQFRYQDFAGVSHIFFSHEHPDHFSPPNIRRIPEEVRKNITVLFQETLDRRVVKLCADFGFKILELPDRKIVKLNGT